MGDKKRGFVVYFDLADSLAAFSDAEVGRIFRAMLAYAENGEELPLPEREAIAFGFIKAQIERDGERYADTCAKRKAAIEARWERERGENTKSTNEYKSIQKIQKYTNDTDIDTDTEKGRDKEKEKDTDTEIVIPPLPPTGERATAKRFEPPTVEEVAAYCKERNNGVDAQRFMDYYTANGWKVGRNAMKDWKAALRSTWERGEDGGKRTKSATAAPFKPDERLLKRAQAHQKEAAK